MNADEDLFGENRLSTLIEDHAELPFDELRERILREVRDFTGELGPHDDMTLILLKVDEIGSRRSRYEVARGRAGWQRRVESG